MHPRIGSLPCALALLLLSAPAAADPWPAEGYRQAVDLTSLVPGTASGFGQQLSDLFWNPTTRTLWVARAPGGVWALKEGGGSLVVANAYAAINADAEGLTQADLNSDDVFVLDESAGTLSRWVAPDSATVAATATLAERWYLGADTRVTPNAAGVVPPKAGNSGPEGVAFVPDEFLAVGGFVSALTDQPFPASRKGMGGLFLIAHQAGGHLYAIDVNPADEHDRELVGRYQTARTESSALAFDRSTGHLFVSHNTGNNTLEIVDLSSSAVSSGLRKLTTLAEFDAPNTSNLEGFALTPAFSSPGVAGDGWCFYCDDDGNSSLDSQLRPHPGLMWFKSCGSLARTAVPGAGAGGATSSGGAAGTSAAGGAAGTSGAGGASGAPAAGGASAAEPEADSGCGCRAARGEYASRAAGWASLVLAIASLGRRRSRRRRG